MIPRFFPGLVLAAAMMAQAIAETRPVLHYDPIPNFYHSALTPPDEFSSSEFNGSVQVYPFRPFQGDITQAFQRTLLREWIDPRFREENVGTRPEFRRGSMQGAEFVITARFAENIVGIMKPRARMLIVSNGAAAIVDAAAGSDSTWQRLVPILNAWPVRVETAAELPAITGNPGPAGRTVAGLYMGMKRKYTVDLLRGAGYGNWVNAAHYYLFSPDGRVYRAYDELAVPRRRSSSLRFRSSPPHRPGELGTLHCEWDAIDDGVRNAANREDRCARSRRCSGDDCVTLVRTAIRLPK